MSKSWTEDMALKALFVLLELYYLFLGFLFLFWLKLC